MVKHLVAGSVRNAVLTRTGLASQARHEAREDFRGRLRQVNDTPPLVYKAGSSAPDLVSAYDEWSAGCRRNAAAKDNLALHAMVHFPAALIPLNGTPEQIARAEQFMLDHAVRFINERNGGDAVFWARLDRDEAGRHNVDVFYAPRYVKHTKSKGAERWISLTKFDKEKALERYAQVPKMVVTKNAKGKRIATPALDKFGNAVTVPGGSLFWRGKALQTDFYEYLRDTARLAGVQRGEEKHTHGNDRLNTEDYKLRQMEDRISALEAQISDLTDAWNGSLGKKKIEHDRLSKRIAEKRATEAQLDRTIAKKQKKIDKLKTGWLSGFTTAQEQDVESRVSAALLPVQEQLTDTKQRLAAAQREQSRSAAREGALRAELLREQRRHSLVISVVSRNVSGAAGWIRDAEAAFAEQQQQRGSPSPTPSPAAVEQAGQFYGDNLEAITAAESRRNTRGGPGGM